MTAASASPSPRRIRMPAVAGSFYPEAPAELAQTVRRLLGQAANHPGNLKALVCPHAGYAFSGLTAAHGFKLLDGRTFATVIVLGPSHFADFKGVALPACDAYATPLGEVPVSPLAQRLVAAGPFVVDPRCRVQAPPWGRAVAAGEATPDTWEHAVEVELPFLQYTLGRFELVPALLGVVDPRSVAAALDPLLDEATLLVVSTDLSHYHSYDEARTLDRSCVEAMLALDTERMADEEACGRTAVITLLHLARRRGWRGKLLDLRNSGDTSGERQRVVGYAALAFFGDDPAQGKLTAEQRTFLLRLARQSIVRSTAGEALPEPEPAAHWGRLAEPRGCFVTLHAQGRLRGCIGNLAASQTLADAVRDNARNAALRDSRFPAVRPGEVPALHIEISVLTEPQPLAFDTPKELLARLRPGVDGVVLEIGGRRATFLPQVWADLAKPEEFLGQLARKAGCSPTDWQRPDAKVQTYQVESFAEPH